MRLTKQRIREIRNSPTSASQREVVALCSAMLVFYRYGETLHEQLTEFLAEEKSINENCNTVHL